MEIKKIADYAFITYLGVGITYAAIRDLYYFTSNKIKENKERKNLERKLNEQNKQTNFM